MDATHPDPTWSPPRPTPNEKAAGTHCQNCQNTRPPRGPAGCAIAAEMEERRLDIAERNILEALTTDDPRMRMASAMITVRYSAKARKHGWIINSSASVDANAVAAAQLRHYRVVWSKPERELAAGEFVRDGRICRRQAMAAIGATTTFSRTSLPRRRR